MLIIVRGYMTFMNYPEKTAQKLCLMDMFQTFYAMDMLQMHDTFLQAPLHLWKLPRAPKNTSEHLSNLQVTPHFASILPNLSLGVFGCFLELIYRLFFFAGEVWSKWSKLTCDHVHMYLRQWHHATVQMKVKQWKRSELCCKQEWVLKWRTRSLEMTSGLYVNNCEQGRIPKLRYFESHKCWMLRTTQCNISQACHAHCQYSTVTCSWTEANVKSYFCEQFIHWAINFVVFYCVRIKFIHGLFVITIILPIAHSWFKQHNLVGRNMMYLIWVNIILVTKFQPHTQCAATQWILATFQ